MARAGRPIVVSTFSSPTVLTGEVVDETAPQNCRLPSLFGMANAVVTSLFDRRTSPDDERGRESLGRGAVAHLPERVLSPTADRAVRQTRLRVVAPDALSVTPMRPGLAVGVDLLTVVPSPS